MKTKLRVAAALVAATTLAFGATAQAATAHPNAANPQDVQIVTTDGTGSLVHTVRHGDGTWQNFGRIGGRNGITALTSTLVNGEENIFFEESSGVPPHLTHLIRHADGTWNLNGTVPAWPDGVSSTGSLVATTGQGRLSLVLLKDGVPQLSTLGSDGVWSEWSAVPTGGHWVHQIAATGDRDTTTVVELDMDSQTVTSFVRGAGDTWSGGSSTPATPNPNAYAVEITAAQVGPDLQVAAIEWVGGWPSVFHSVQHGNAGWDPFRDLTGAVPVFKGEPLHVAIAASPAGFTDELQLVYTTATGGMYHTIRHSNGAWQPLGDVEGAAGHVAAGAVSIAGHSS
ncbi:hypothetical protein [Kutzneria sp. 744]|uniref:hypothetical protein n=1 Tax=Kutzneria sp. (strain 744) TaxID=345341 RepID=UPI0003EEC748|nr:hypothetical protein [Kutzneria sp. 744]EWM13918.1 LigA protein [Kutzneria sp. 744]